MMTKTGRTKRPKNDRKITLDVTGKGHDEADELVVIDNPAAQNALYNWLARRGDQPGAIFTSLSDRSHGQPLSLQAIRAIVKGCSCWSPKRPENYPQSETHRDHFRDPAR